MNLEPIAHPRHNLSSEFAEAPPEASVKLLLRSRGTAHFGCRMHLVDHYPESISINVSYADHSRIANLFKDP